MNACLILFSTPMNGCTARTPDLSPRRPVAAAKCALPDRPNRNIGGQIPAGRTAKFHAGGWRVNCDELGFVPTCTAHENIESLGLHSRTLLELAAYENGKKSADHLIGGAS